MIALWQRCRGGMGGYQHMPFAGGAADQPAIVMSAFSVIARVHSLLNPVRKGN